MHLTKDLPAYLSSTIFQINISFSRDNKCNHQLFAEQLQKSWRQIPLLLQLMTDKDWRNNAKLTRCDTVFSRDKASVNCREAWLYLFTRCSSPLILKWKKWGKSVLTFFPSSFTVHHTTLLTATSCNLLYIWYYSKFWDKVSVSYTTALSVNIQHKTRTINVFW